MTSLHHNTATQILTEPLLIRLFTGYHLDNHRLPLHRDQAIQCLFRHVLPHLVPSLQSQALLVHLANKSQVPQALLPQPPPTALVLYRPPLSAPSTQTALLPPPVLHLPALRQHHQPPQLPPSLVPPIKCSLPLVPVLLACSALLLTYCKRLDRVGLGYSRSFEENQSVCIPAGVSVRLGKKV